MLGAVCLRAVQAALHELLEYSERNRAATQGVPTLHITHITKYIPVSGALVPVVAGSAPRDVAR